MRNNKQRAYKGFYIFVVCPELYKETYYTVQPMKPGNRVLNAVMEQCKVQRHNGYFLSVEDCHEFIDWVLAEYDNVRQSA
jgi:hypothetical protein